MWMWVQEYKDNSKSPRQNSLTLSHLFSNMKVSMYTTNCRQGRILAWLDNVCLHGTVLYVPMYQALALLAHYTITCLYLQMKVTCSVYYEHVTLLAGWTSLYSSSSKQVMSFCQMPSSSSSITQLLHHLFCFSFFDNTAIQLPYMVLL